MKKLLLPSLLLTLAGFGCGNSAEDTSPVRAQTVTIGSEMDVIDTDNSPEAYEAATYAREQCTLNEVQFSAGEYALDEAGYERLDQLASCLKGGEIGELTVVGVDDPEANAEDAHHLAERRAMLVVDYLLDAGLDEPDVRYDGQSQATAFVLTWPNAQVAVTGDANRG